MKSLTYVGLLFILLPVGAFANEFCNRAPGFDVPIGQIAYMGSFFSPLPVHQTNSNTQFLSPKDNRLFADKFFVAPKTQAVNETNQAVQEVATQRALSITDVSFDERYQNVLLMHVLKPEKYQYNPGIGKYCGGKPYILIGVIDYYAEFSCSINLRENENGEKINYMGRRSIIERDFSMFRTKGRQAAVALELFLVSSVDGSTLWQCNTITTFNGIGDGYYGITKGLVESALKNLMKQ